MCKQTGRGRSNNDHQIKVPKYFYVGGINSPIKRKNFFLKNQSMFYFNPVEGEGWKTQNKGRSLFI